MYNSKKKRPQPWWHSYATMEANSGEHNLYLVLFLGKYNSLLWTTGQTSQKVTQCLMLVDFPDFNYRQSIIIIIVFVIF